MRSVLAYESYMQELSLISKGRTNWFCLKGLGRHYRETWKRESNFPMQVKSECYSEEIEYIDTRNYLDRLRNGSCLEFILFERKKGGRAIVGNWAGK